MKPERSGGVRTRLARFALSFVLALEAAFFAAPAQACILAPRHDLTIAEDYDNKRIRSTLLVEVVAIKSAAQDGSAERTTRVDWVTKVRVLEPVFGAATADKITLEPPFAVILCSLNRSVRAKVGDKAVVYLDKKREPLYALPLKLALALDPRVKAHLNAAARPQITTAELNEVAG